MLRMRRMLRIAPSGGDVPCTPRSDPNDPLHPEHPYPLQRQTGPARHALIGERGVRMIRIGRPMLRIAPHGDDVPCAGPAPVFLNLG